MRPLKASQVLTRSFRVRLTRKGEVVYAILLARPKSSSVSIEGLSPSAGSEIRLVGQEGSLIWTQEGDNLAIRLPSFLPESYAYALRITPARLR